MEERNETVDALRALAALAVCFFHFTRFEHFQAVSMLGRACNYGALGIEVFFVISGFIVPYAMWRAGYTLRAWPAFMWKRLVRLEPPYLVSIALVLALAAASALLTGSSEQAWPTAAQLASHIGYLTALLGHGWLNIVYWSLAIELQFYFLCSLLMPVIGLLRREISRVALVLALAALPSLVPRAPEHTLLPYLPIFGLGLLAFLVKTALIGRALFWVAAGSLVALLAFTLPWPAVVVAAGTASVLVCVRMPRLGPVAWLGTLSYSLYLVHVPVGGRLIALGARWPASAWLELILVLVAFALSIGVAYLLYVSVERPSRMLAGRIHYAR